MDPEGSQRAACEKAFNSTADCEDGAGHVRGLQEHSVSLGHQRARKRVPQMSGTEFCTTGINPKADFPHSLDINKEYTWTVAWLDLKQRTERLLTHKLVSNKCVSFKAAKSVAVCYSGKRN